MIRTWFPMPSYSTSEQFCFCSDGSNGSLAPSLEAECPHRQKGQNRTAARHMASVTVNNPPPQSRDLCTATAFLSVSYEPVQKLQPCYGNAPLLPNCR